jgi:hypothetical protein
LSVAEKLFFRGASPWQDVAMIEAFLEPGVLVRHPGQPSWGVGQVQSIDDHRVTVTFEDAGKRVIDIRHVTLDYIGPDPRDDGRGV